MRRFSKALAATGLAVGALALGACGGHGPNSYLMPKDAVKAKLTGKAKEYRVLNADPRSIVATSWNGDSLNVTLSGKGVKPTRCKATVEAIDEKWTRVSPSCPEGKTAIEKTESEIARMQVDEFIIAVLYDKPVDESMVAKRISAIALDNMGDMQKQMVDEIDAAAAASSSAYADAEWNANSGSDWGN